MPVLNFTVFTDKVASGEKTQTIRLPRKDIKVGQKVSLWWNKRGLKKGKYCSFCAHKGLFVEPHLHPDLANTPIAVSLPAKLGVGIVTEKLPMNLCLKEDTDFIGVLPCSLPELSKRDGFETAEDFLNFFEAHYPTLKKQTVEFEVIRWKLVKP